MQTSDIINLVGLCISVPLSLIAIGISAWVAWISQSQKRIAETQSQIAQAQKSVAEAQAAIAGKELTLSAYNNAVQGIIEIKNMFAEKPQIFEKQMEITPTIRAYIPSDMDIPTFLVFARGMWLFSYVYSVKSRWQEFGMTKSESIGLEQEMLLWLQEIPGFYEVYRSHTSVVKAQNPDFLDFLNKQVYNEDFYHRHPYAEVDRLKRMQQATDTRDA